MTRESAPAGKILVRYELEHKGTAAGTGWFAPTPVGQVDFEDGLEYMKQHPNDEFLHRHMLNMLGSFGPNLTAQLIDRGLEGEPHLAALIYESCYLQSRFLDLLEKYEEKDLVVLAKHTPLIYIRWMLNKSPEGSEDWLSLFADNIIKHKPLIPPADMKQPLPYSLEALENWGKNITAISQLYPENNVVEPGPKRLGLEETARIATKRLEAMGLERSSENPNPASINPMGLLMKWQMDVSVTTGRHRIKLSGTQTSYGKGLTPEEARASCLMEVCERVSSFASFEGDCTARYKNGHQLLHCRLTDLKEQGIDALDPNEMHLEIPYDDHPLYWMPGERIDAQGTHPVHIPAQLVFLFCNLDEAALSDGMPSTGLASGNTLAEAKLSALLEVFERDAERVMPYLPERCFSLKADTPLVKDILEQTRNQGLQVQFLDITTELGIPCYKAFVQNPNGEILKGCSAHLDGKRAAVSSLLEVPYHASWFQPVPGKTVDKEIQLEDLPDYSTGNAGQDLERLEKLLLANGYSPIYVDLTREDLDIPVVKALIPRLEFFPEFDQFSTLSIRQFVHYLGAFS